MKTLLRRDRYGTFHGIIPATLPQTAEAAFCANQPQRPPGRVGVREHDSNAWSHVFDVPRCPSSSRKGGICTNHLFAEIYLIGLLLFSVPLCPSELHAVGAKGWEYLVTRVWIPPPSTDTTTRLLAEPR